MDQISAYDPPDAGFTPDETQYAYDLDRRPTMVTLPDGRTVETTYDAGGRVATVETSDGARTFGYSPTTGRLDAISTWDGETLASTSDGSLLSSVTAGGTVSATLSMSYDANFAVATQTLSTTPAISFSRDADLLLMGAGALIDTTTTRRHLRRQPAWSGASRLPSSGSPTETDRSSDDGTETHRRFPGSSADRRLAARGASSVGDRMHGVPRRLFRPVRPIRAAAPPVREVHRDLFSCVQESSD